MSHDGVALDTPGLCRRELERCSSALAELTPTYTELQEELGAVEESLEVAEALATVELADRFPKVSATILKARVFARIAEDETGAGKLYRRRRELRARLEVIDRRFRSVERRGSFAQSALSSHMEEARSAGFVESIR